MISSFALEIYATFSLHIAELHLLDLKLTSVALCSHIPYLCSHIPYLILTFLKVIASRLSFFKHAIKSDFFHAISKWKGIYIDFSMPNLFNKCNINFLIQFLNINI